MEITTTDLDSSDSVFGALAHPTRRKMLDLLVNAPGSSVKWLAGHFPVSRIAVMKHLAVLESAELVISEKEGRTRKLFFNPVPIQHVYDRWTTQYSSFWAGRVADIQARVEERSARESEKHA